MKTRIFLLGAAVLVAVPAFAVPGQTASSPAPCALVNGGFEQPTGVKGQGYLSKSVPGWRSSAADGLIELWGPGNKADPMNFTIPADSGSQFAEINATSNSPLSQDVATVPGTTLTWSLAHRARTPGPNKKDVMRVRIGGVAQTPEGLPSPDIADGGDAWGHYKGSYTVPAGQTVTKIELVPVSSGVGIVSYGNFVDSVEVSCGAQLSAPDAVLSGPVGKKLQGTVATGESQAVHTVTDPSKLPPGVTIGADGTVSGTPTATGTYRVPVKACDGANCAQGEAVFVIHDCPEPQPEETP